MLYFSFRSTDSRCCSDSRTETYEPEYGLSCFTWAGGRCGVLKLGLELERTAPAIGGRRKIESEFRGRSNLGMEVFARDRFVCGSGSGSEDHRVPRRGLQENDVGHS